MKTKTRKKTAPNAVRKRPDLFDRMRNAIDASTSINVEVFRALDALAQLDLPDPAVKNQLKAVENHLKLLLDALNDMQHAILALSNWLRFPEVGDPSEVPPNELVQHDL